MSDPMIGEIRLFPYGWAPENWVWCDGRQLQIRAFPALYATIGNAYGGDQQTYFNVPDLRARVAVGYGDDPNDVFDPEIGSHGGVQNIALSTSQVPPHTHTLNGAVISTIRQEVAAPGQNWISTELLIKPTKGSEISNTFTTTSTPDVMLHPSTLSSYQGQGQAHENRQPYLTIGYYIATFGEFAPRP